MVLCRMRGLRAVAALAGLVVGSLGTGSARAAEDDPAARAHGLVAAGLARAAPVIAAEKRRAEAACRGPDDLMNTALTVTNGVVTAAPVLGEIDGAARAAGTTGGLGGKVLVVRSAQDYLPRQEPVVDGSLRQAIDRARLLGRPAWIVFDRALAGRTITLKSALRPGDDLTVDAGCADIRLIAAASVPLIVIKDHRNIVLTGLTLAKEPYVGENKGRADGRDFRDCVTLSGDVDAVAILHDEFGACGDGQIDITSGVGKKMPTLGGRITVAFNRFGKHDKSSLLGTDGCEDASATLAQGCAELAWLGGPRRAPPAYTVSWQGNLYLWTGQRNPRLFGLVWAQAVNNVYAFEPYDRGDGTSGAAYGQYVSDGARLLSEANVYVGVGSASRPALGLYTTTSAHATHAPEDVEGAIAARDNLVAPGVEVADNRASALSDGSGLPLIERVVALAPLGLSGAIACIASRAGTWGARDWPQSLCKRFEKG